MKEYRDANIFLIDVYVYKYFTIVTYLMCITSVQWIVTLNRIIIDMWFVSLFIFFAVIHRPFLRVNIIIETVTLAAIAFCFDRHL